MDKIYKEKQSSSFLVRLAFLLGAVLFWGMAYRSWFIGAASSQPIVRIVLSLLAVIFLVWFGFFSALRIELTEKYLRFGFGLLRRTFRWEQIQEASLEKFDFNNYQGYGIRRGRDGSWGYLAAGSRGIRLRTSNQVFFLTSDNPEKLLDLIKKHYCKI